MDIQKRRKKVNLKRSLSCLSLRLIMPSLWRPKNMSKSLQKQSQKKQLLMTTRKLMLEVLKNLDSQMQNLKKSLLLSQERGMYQLTPQKGVQIPKYCLAKWRFPMTR